MSNLKVALVAEGPTDRIVIEAALNKIIDTPFILTLLQPDSANSINGGFSATGSGWAGVYRWCRQMEGIGAPPLENNPLLSRYDLIIIHLDGDVAEESYGNGNIHDNPVNDLPCLVWPPNSASDISQGLENVVLGWLGQNQKGLKTVFCFPSYCTETWVASALYGMELSEAAGPDVELFKQVYQYLLSKPKAERILSRKGNRVRKTGKKFQARQHEISKHWHQCIALCSQARAFEDHIWTAI